MKNKYVLIQNRHKY